MSSPVIPSPLVAARCNTPFLYINEPDKPSILGSRVYSGFGITLLTLSSNAIISSSLKISSNDNIGFS